MSPYSSVWALKPNVLSLLSLILPATTAPSTPAFSAICLKGASSARFTIAIPAF